MAKTKATALEAERLQAEVRRLQGELDSFTGARKEKMGETFTALIEFYRDELAEFPLCETRDLLQSVVFVLAGVAKREGVEIKVDVDEWRAFQTYGPRLAAVLDLPRGDDHECDCEEDR